MIAMPIIIAVLYNGMRMVLVTSPLVLSKQKIIQTSYYYRNALSRAVMVFLANQKPLDFSDP
jgi:hypothetical protein